MASLSPHSGSFSPWVQPRGQDSVSSCRSGNASISWSGSTWASPNDRIPGVSTIQPPPGRASISAVTEVCRPRPVTAFTTPTDRKASGTSALTSVDLPTPLCPSSTLVRPASRSTISVEVGAALRDDVRHSERAVAGEHRLRVGEVGLGQAQERVHARVVRRDEGPVDQALAGLGVGEGRDDDELVGVGDDHALDGVVVVGRTPKHGLALVHRHDARQRALGTGGVADETHAVAGDHRLAAQ